MHAIGDAACRVVLDAFERAAVHRGFGAAAGQQGSRLRNRIEHAQLLHPDDFARFSRLGIVASMQPLHATSDMIIAERYWGERCRCAYAWKSLLDAGAALAFGSDCPVEVCSPLAGIHAAVTRRRADGSPGNDGWHPEQRLTVAQAVHAYTLGAAYASGRESELGSVSAGKRADLTVLDGAEPVGVTTSGTFSPTLKVGIALALIDADAGIEDGAVVNVDVRGRALECEVVKPPFVDVKTR